MVVLTAAYQTLTFQTFRPTLVLVYIYTQRTYYARHFIHSKDLFWGLKVVVVVPPSPVELITYERKWLTHIAVYEAKGLSLADDWSSLTGLGLGLRIFLPSLYVCTHIVSTNLSNNSWATLGGTRRQWYPLYTRIWYTLLLFYHILRFTWYTVIRYDMIDMLDIGCRRTFIVDEKSRLTPDTWYPDPLILSTCFGDIYSRP